MRIVHAYTHLDRIGGAESMAVLLYRAMREKGVNAFIAAGHSYDKIHKRYKRDIDPAHYIRLKMFYPAGKETLFISHHRKLTTLYLLQSPANKKRCIHIAHNEFDTLRRFTLFPDYVVAVSNKVKANLTDFFKVPEEKIHVIYNAVPEPEKASVHSEYHRPLRIVYPARVNSVKRQLDLVREIKRHDLDDIVVRFCGNGPQLDELKELTRDDPRFEVLGMVEDMPEQYRNADWVALYTEREGLPVSLIEACAYGVPVMCNDVGGNTEIVTQGDNGYIVSSYDELIEKIRMARQMPVEEYRKLSKNARERYQNLFSVVKMMESYMNLVNQYTDRQR